MQFIANQLVFSPTDLMHFLECEYLTRLDVEVANGRVLERRRTAEAELLAVKGDAHEGAQLEEFERNGLRIERIGCEAGGFDWDAGRGQTERAMAAGADVIYQAVLAADGWRGKADFLVKMDTPSALGGWSYEVWDTKLARHAKPPHLLQLAYYSERVAVIQRRDPEWMHLVLGTGERVRFRTETSARISVPFSAASSAPSERTSTPSRIRSRTVMSAGIPITAERTGTRPIT